MKVYILWVLFEPNFSCIIWANAYAFNEMPILIFSTWNKHYFFFGGGGGGCAGVKADVRRNRSWACDIDLGHQLLRRSNVLLDWANRVRKRLITLWNIQTSYSYFLILSWSTLFSSTNIDILECWRWKADLLNCLNIYSIVDAQE